MMNSGIYRIRNLINDKIYVGRSYQLSRRERVHFNSLQNGSHYNHKLQRAVNKYGIENFVFEVIEYANADLLPDLEQKYIDDLNACSMYNISKSAYNGACRDDPVFMEKVTTASRRYWSNPENRLKQSITLAGKTKTISHKERISSAKSGCSLSKQHVDAVVQSQNHTRLLGNHKRSFPVIIDGILYQSIRNAAGNLNMNERTLRKMVESFEFPNYQYMNRE